MTQQECPPSELTSLGFETSTLLYEIAENGVLSLERTIWVELEL
jgi:hypothetical protein